VVKEQLPPAGYDSPYVYTFTIREAGTDRDLKGESYRRDTDSVSLTDLKFAWADDELTVSLPIKESLIYGPQWISHFDLHPFFNSNGS
jgi:hypothetical protein